MTVRTRRRRTRILVCSERFWPETFVVNQLVEHLVSEGNDVTVLTQQPSYPSGRLPYGWKNRWITRDGFGGATVLRHRTVLGYRDSVLKKILNYLSFVIFGSLTAIGHLFKRPDVVFVYQTGPLTVAIPGIVVAKLKRVPLHIWTQDLWPDAVYAYGVPKLRPVSSLLDLFVRFVYRQCDSISVSSPSFATSLARYTPKEIVVIPNWPLHPLPRHPLPFNRCRRFLFAGNIGKFQNLENVIRGYAIARSVEPRIGCLVIAGDGSERRSIERYCVERGIPVTWLGRLAPTVVDTEFALADVVVLSLTDRSGIGDTVPSKFQSYLSAGRPILVAARSSVAEISVRAGCGVGANPSSPEAIADAFVRLAGMSDASLAKMADRAHKLYELDYAPRPAMTRISQTIKRLVAGVD